MGLFHRKQNKLDVQSNRYGVDLVAKDYPASIISEQFRTIRTNLSFSRAEGRLRSIMFTSDAPSQGKSTITANLAVIWANQGKKTCLVDCDMRRSTVHQTFMLQNQLGLSTYLANQSDLGHTLQPTSVNNLTVMTAGPTPPNPSELLASNNMDNMLRLLYDNFDIVLLDTPPVNSTSDASILAAKADGVIVVIPQKIALKASVQAEIDQLKKVHARILGAVMNHVVDHQTNGYYYYYYK